MKSAKFNDVFRIVRPDYVYVKLTPNNSIRNNKTDLIARSISSIYRNILNGLKREEEKLIRLLGREFVVGTKYRYQTQGKVAYYVYIEKQRVDFYFIIPRQYYTIIKEKMSDVWQSVTVKEVDESEVPTFSDDATKYAMAYEKEDALSLRVDRRDNNLLQSHLNVVDVMEEGDKAGIYYNFVPTSQGPFRHSYRATIDKVKRGLPVDRNKAGAGYLFKLTMAFIDGLVNSLSEAVAGKSEKKSEDNVLDSLIDRLNGGKKVSESTDKKSGASIIDSQIVVMSESEDALRRRNNAQSLVQSFDVVSEDNKLVGKRFNGKVNMRAKHVSKAPVNKISDGEAQNFISLAGRDLLEQHNFIEKINTQETQVPEDLRKGVMNIGEVTYRGVKQPAYLSDYEHYRNLLTLLIGPTRAGKSNLIGNLSIDAIQNGECNIIFDFIQNNELSDEVSALFPDDKVLSIDVTDPNKLQGLGYNEVGYTADPFKQYENAKRQTANLLALVNAINVDESRLSPKMERYLESAALTVFVHNGSIRDVFRVLQNHELRHEFIAKVPAKFDDFMEEYLTALTEIDDKNKGGEIIGTRTSSIVGIIDRLSVLKRNTYMEMMLKNDMSGNIDLVEEMQKNQVICIRMPESKFPTEGERDICTTYWITKLWMALQIRADKFKQAKDRVKVNLIIDEIYQVNNTEKFIKTKLSQIAKFTCKPIISCHYINQLNYLRSELRSANTSYMLISGCDEANYSELKNQLYPFTAEDLANMKPYHSMNYVKSRDGYARFITKLPGKVEDRIKKYSADA